MIFYTIQLNIGFDFDAPLRLRNFELSRCKREIYVIYSPMIRKHGIGFYMDSEKLLYELRNIIWDRRMSMNL